LWLAQYSTQLTYQIPKRTAANGATRAAWNLVYLFSKKKKSNARAIPGRACRARSTLRGNFINAAAGDDSGMAGIMRRGNKMIKLQ
jgi:hypothetical protein